MFTNNGFQVNGRRGTILQQQHHYIGCGISCIMQWSASILIGVERGLQGVTEITEYNEKKIDKSKTCRR